MKKENEIIHLTRKLMSESSGDVVSESTRKNYLSEGLRLLRFGEYNLDFVVDRAAKTTSARTWFRRRAALIWFCRWKIGAWLEAHDHPERYFESVSSEGEPGASIEGSKTPENSIDFWIRLWTKVESRNKPDLLDPRRSKRKDLRHLPNDWREKLVARMPNYLSANLVLAISGCRPSELVKGVCISVFEGSLTVEIQGSKVKENAGQPVRRLTWILTDAPKMVLQLADMVGPSGTLIVKVKDARLYSGAMSAAGKREWPRRQKKITPYSLRHQVASDWKKQGMDSIALAMALGHAVDKTQSIYGCASQGGGFGLPMVEATRSVRRTKNQLELVARVCNDKKLS